MRKLAHFALFALALSACENQEEATEPEEEEAAEPRRRAAPREEEVPPLDPTNIASIAIKSADHTKLVAALKAAQYVTGVSNAGPLTVFAPTDAAFDALPAGTVENLLKPENVDQLRHILQHHVVPASYPANQLRDGQTLGMVDGTNVTVHVAGEEIHIDEAKVVTSVRASNGVLHIIDKVLLPPERH